MRIEKIVKLFVPAILLGACATGGAVTGRGTTSSAVSASEDEFPPVNKPRLPTADRLSDTIRAQAGEVASADVRLCVTPDGHVDGVSLVRGSPSSAYNRAVVKDITDWQFGGSSDPSNLDSCEIATITYRPHS
jgi:TonB family protein